MSLFYLLLLRAAGGALKLYRQPLAYMRLYNVYTLCTVHTLDFIMVCTLDCTNWCHGSLQRTYAPYIQSLSSSPWPLVHWQVWSWIGTNHRTCWQIMLGPSKFKMALRDCHEIKVCLARAHQNCVPSIPSRGRKEFIKESRMLAKYLVGIDKERRRCWQGECFF